MAVGESRFAAEWLALREPADAAARASALLAPLREQLAAQPRPLVIRDLGCGTGAMARWLAGQLPGPQRWIMNDRDPALLAQVDAGPALAARDGSEVTVSTQQRDVTDLTAAELAGTSLVTTSALLDLLTAEEVAGLATACLEAGCPALLTLSVAGRAEFTPADPLDADLTAAFNAHQRRVTGGRRLLGPDAAAVTAEAFTTRGGQVHRQASPWRLGPDQAALTAQWLPGWVAAACEQRPALAGAAQTYLRRRLDAAAAGALQVVLHHWDLPALPPPQLGADA